MAFHSSILAWRIPMDREAWQATAHGIAESDTTERLSRAQLNHHPISLQEFNSPLTVAEYRGID